MKARQYWLLALLVFAAFALRIYHLDTVDLRGDEGYTARLWIMTPFTGDWIHMAKYEPSPAGSFIIYWLWRDLNALRQRFGLAEFPEVAYLIGSIFLAPVFFSLVLLQLNEYWDVRTHGLASDAELNSFENAMLVIGGCLLALWVLALCVGIIVLLVSAAG